MKLAVCDFDLSADTGRRNPETKDSAGRGNVQLKLFAAFHFQRLDNFVSIDHLKRYLFDIAPAHLRGESIVNILRDSVKKRCRTVHAERDRISGFFLFPQDETASADGIMKWREIGQIPLIAFGFLI